MNTLKKKYVLVNVCLDIFYNHTKYYMPFGIRISAQKISFKRQILIKNNTF